MSVSLFKKYTLQFFTIILFPYPKVYSERRESRTRPCLVSVRGKLRTMRFQAVVKVIKPQSCFLFPSVFAVWERNVMLQKQATPKLRGRKSLTQAVPQGSHRPPGQWEDSPVGGVALVSVTKIVLLKFGIPYLYLLPQSLILSDILFVNSGLSLKTQSHYYL